MTQNITVYGAKGCSRTNRTQVQLRSLAVGYEFVNVDTNPMGREEVLELYKGTDHLPVVVIEGCGTRILREPDEVQLLNALTETRVISHEVIAN